MNARSAGFAVAINLSISVLRQPPCGYLTYENKYYPLCISLKKNVYS
jgi:hypothetical protein